LLIVFIASLAVLVLLDQVAARVVANQVAVRAQRTQNLPERPVIALGGFPFLTQVVTGHYRDVDVQVRGYATAGPRVDQVRAELDGVRFPLLDVVRGRMNRIVVGRLHAEVDITFADIDAYLRSRGSAVRVQVEGDAVRVSGTLRVLGRSYALSATADIGVVPDAVTLTPRDLTQGFGSLLPSPVRGIARAMLTVTFPVAGLPAAVGLLSATVRSDRLTFTAGGDNVVFATASLRPTSPGAGASPRPRRQAPDTAAWLPDEPHARDAHGGPDVAL
jgi:hypothetical protein